MSEGWTVQEIIEDDDHKNVAVKKAATVVFDLLFDKYYGGKK